MDSFLAKSIAVVGRATRQGRENLAHEVRPQIDTRVVPKSSVKLGCTLGAQYISARVFH